LKVGSDGVEDMNKRENTLIAAKIDDDERI
jgi:hypothetical protein